MVGSSVRRCFEHAGFTHLLTPSSAEVDLTDQKQVRDFFVESKPEIVIIAAAKVGGILANNTYRADFIYPSHERSERYLIVEIDTFEGRSVETKKDLVRQITRRINEATGIEPRDIDVIITEQARHNWGLMGQPGDEIALTYKVAV